METNEKVLRQQLLQKAATKLSDITSGGGLLQPEQLDAFLEMAMEQRMILGEARVETVSSGQKVLDRIGVGSRFLGVGSEDDTTIYSDPATNLGKEKKPDLGKLTISCSKVSGRTAISHEVLKRNIEKEGFSDTVMRLLAARAGYDLEDLAINGDTTDGALEAYLQLKDGALKRVPAANRVGWGGADFKSSVFADLINSIGAKYRRNISEFRFYCSHGIEMAYRQYLVDQRKTALGDTAQTDKFELKAFGVPVVGVDVMPDRGTANEKEGTILLCHPKNLIWAVEDELRIVDWLDNYRDSLIIAFHASVDTLVEEVNALASAQRVGWDIGGS